MWDDPRGQGRWDWESVNRVVVLVVPAVGRECALTQVAAARHNCLGKWKAAVVDRESWKAT